MFKVVIVTVVIIIIIIIMAVVLYKINKSKFNIINNNECVPSSHTYRNKMYVKTKDDRKMLKSIKQVMLRLITNVIIIQI